MIAYAQDVNETLDSLRAVFPKYVCFVTTPEETTRQFVAEAPNLTRRLDDDPYTDVIWGIVTGYTADDALRLAKHRTPLTVRRALTGTVGAPLDAYDAGLMYNELKVPVMVPNLRVQQGKRHTAPLLIQFPSSSCGVPTLDRASVAPSSPRGPTGLVPHSGRTSRIFAP